MSLLERIIATGNRGHGHPNGVNHIRCVDGFTVSVIAGGGTYCTPRPALCIHGVVPDADPAPVVDSILGDASCDFPGPYTAVEVGYPSELPEPWEEWSSYAEAPDAATSTVYAWVPVDLVRALLAAHGGEQ